MSVDPLRKIRIVPICSLRDANIRNRHGKTGFSLKRVQSGKAMVH